MASPKVIEYSSGPNCCSSSIENTASSPSALAFALAASV